MTKQLRHFIAEQTRAQDGTRSFEQRLHFLHGALTVRSNSMKAIAALKERFVHYLAAGNDAAALPKSADILLVKKCAFPARKGKTRAFRGDVFWHDQDNGGEFLWKENRVLVHFSKDPEARIVIIVNQPARTTKSLAKINETKKVPVKNDANFVNWEEIADLLFLIFARTQNRICVHAACLSHHGQGILITGSSGSGKSTTALSLLRGGFTYHSDEITVLPADAGDPFLVSGLMLSPRIRARIACLDDLEESIGCTFSGSSIPQALPAQVIASGRDQAVKPVAVIVIDPVAVRKKRHRMQALDEQSALVTLLGQLLDPTSHSRQHQVFDTLGRMVGMCRLFRLEAGSDIASLPAFIRRHALDQREGIGHAGK